MKRNKLYKLSSLKSFFVPWYNAIITAVLTPLILITGFKLFNWLLVKGIWQGDASLCRQSEGACLAFVKEKARFILFGTYPDEQLYRPILVIILFVAGFIYISDIKRWNKRLLLYMAIALVFIFWLMGGGFFLMPVDSSYWSGLPLTLILAFLAITISYPVGILLALGRQSHSRLLKGMSVAYIELIRGVPLISVLFMASVMLPLFLPEGLNINKLLRAVVALTMFVAAYHAEVVRGGLAAVSHGQDEAAMALGLTYFQRMRLIILPQALKAVIPPTINTTIGMFKDTSLVIVISLFDLMGTTKSSLTDSKWLGFSIEAYLFVALIYFIFCISLSRIGSKLEKYKAT